MGAATARTVIAALALGMLAARANADIRAEYVNERGMVVSTVEIDDSGQIRSGSLGGGYYLATTDGEYFVDPGPGGPVAISLEASAWLARGRSTEGFSSADWEPAWEYEPGDEARVGTMVGRAYRPLTASGEQRLPTIIISEDPALAPIGLAQVRQHRAFLTRNNRPDVLDRYYTLLLKGAALANANQRLGAVSFDPIAPERFQLPVTPVTLADVAGAQPSEPPAEPEGRRSSVVQAAFWDHALWTLDDRGTVRRTPEGGQELTQIDTPGLAAAICRSPNALWLVTWPGETRLQLWTRSAAGGWDARGEAEGAVQTPLGIECSGERPLLLLGDKVVEAGGRAFPLSGSGEAVPRGFPVLLRIGDALYLGLNAGEWGGGLRRIDLRAGAGVTIEAGNTQELCGGVLNFRCAPVTGLAPDPSRPECLLVAVGLVHFSPSGEVVRVCGNEAERIYRKPYTLDPEWRDEDIKQGVATVPFFAMSGGEGAAWAVGADGLYRFGAEPKPELHQFPKIRAGGIDWSYPEVVLIPTDMNQRHSLSGGSLLLVPR